MYWWCRHEFHGSSTRRGGSKQTSRRMSPSLPKFLRAVIKIGPLGGSTGVPQYTDVDELIIAHDLSADHVDVSQETGFTSSPPSLVFYPNSQTKNSRRI